jgi:hypothetical protein
MARQDREAHLFIADVIARKDKIPPQWIYEHIEDPDHADFQATLLFYKMGVQNWLLNEKTIKSAI